MKITVNKRPKGFISEKIVFMADIITVTYIDNTIHIVLKSKNSKEKKLYEALTTEVVYD